jgi:threonyl-tRNA synthetase
MLHRAIFGSLERFIGILLENYAGALPFWLSPVQIVVATITSEADAYAREVVAELASAGLRAEADVRNEKINYKVREHSLAKVPVILAAGKREVADRTVALRRFGSQNQTSLALGLAVEQLRSEAAARGAR